MQRREFFYETALRGVRPLLRVAAPLNEKLGRGVAGRREATARLEAWAAESRDPMRPLVWVHAPSVGEGLMAQAIISALREQQPEVQVAFTFFSPSAERLAAQIGADVYDYLPWDVRREVGRALDALQPDVVAFVRTEVWPVLAYEARRRGARLALINAVLGDDSSRLGWGARFLLGPTYARLDAIGATGNADASRFTELGAVADRVEVTGDARFDQVWRRVRALGDLETRLEDPLLRRLHDPEVTTIVAGSTWPTDESQLVPALSRARRGLPLRLIAAPHEPNEDHLTGLERTLSAAGLEHARLATVESSGEPLPEVVIVDRVGVLADLYAIGDIAYVGGGFHGAGLHSVIEPAALGVPVLYGPRHGNAREASELAWSGGGSVVRDVPELASLLETLARDAAEREEAGRAALAYVRSRLGGAERNAELLGTLLRAESAVTGR